MFNKEESLRNATAKKIIIMNARQKENKISSEMSQYKNWCKKMERVK